ncbi:PQQ-binding-like beta-propeller repeat protein [Nocardia sp. CDC153]|uniref:outer membrane protein assembly factor BamB family protein n=1 Tax=Nocardia sp. CDC153 TaxID=3112167 RepID=UPI002DBF9DFB|nr:PQQ-binding-like beta-propeller repeat protein [Nocardia sp. CDC153]MEC3953331.1 PQQ-binding-like beta-propeller repeat protein [Nocardia sp. CDC153]
MTAHRMRTLLAVVGACGVIVAMSGCGGSTDAPPPREAPPSGTVISLDGAVYGRPIAVGDTVIAATETGSIYAVAGDTVRWRTHVADPVPGSQLPCGNIDPVGITGAPAYDASAHRVYVVAESAGAHKTLYGLDSDTGAVTLRVPVDPPFGDAPAYLQRPALTVRDGHVYAAFGGNYGDCGTYTGAVAAVDVSASAVTWYRASTSGKGGIWAPGPPAEAAGLLFYSVGNGDAEPGSAYDDTDSVIALTPDLRRADFFAPTGWAQDNAADRDLGTMNPVLVGRHLLMAGKSGDGYVLDPAHLGGISSATPAFTGCKAFGPAAVDTDVAYLPCTKGAMAVRVSDTGAATVLWHTTAPANGPPLVAAGRVWATDWHAGTLYALDPATGNVLAQYTTGALPHFAAPLLANGVLVLGTMSGLEYFRP